MDIFLIRKVRTFVKAGSIETTKDYRKDVFKNNFKEKEMEDTLIRGVHFEKTELDLNPEKHASKFYAVHKIFFKYFLIGYDIYNDHITLIHTSLAGNWEINQYKKEKKRLKKRTIGPFL